MAKGASDIILRDRLQFNLDNNGDRTTVYGRIDLSDYVNPVEKEGLSIKEVLFQLRDTDGSTSTLSLTNTGIMVPLGTELNASGVSAVGAGIKVYATTRAYENANDVGIASPDVIAVEEWWFVGAPYDNANAPSDAGSPGYHFGHNRYGPTDLHPSGFTIVSDLLIGVAVDNMDEYDDDTLELDVMLIASPTKVTAKELTQMLTQAQDL